MSKSIIKVVRYFIFYCPGCNRQHSVTIEGENNWTIIGTVDNPTIEPSILNYTLEMKVVNNKEVMKKKEVCHLFIREGKIEYQTDSHHDLSGKTIDMKDI